jgi:glycosyltransferase involved in cell wall biosynthesis
MKISIVTAYYNRKSLFYETLKSIVKSKFKDFELIVVDDGSSPEHRLEGYLEEFPFMKIIRLEPENKWYTNPCIPFNVGIRATIGSIIVLQNPECLHVGDVLTHISERVNNSNYVSISAYALNEELTNRLSSVVNDDNLITYFKQLPQQPTGGSPIVGWYNHSRFRPMYYHFCSAITKKNMDLLGGFDERYAYGISYDDNEFIERIGRLRLNKIILDEVSVIHQWHPSVYYVNSNFAQLHEKNRLLFENVTKCERKIRVN